MAATIKDVAKYANVSPSTVSRVLADNPKISDETKKRVFEAVKALNYHPNVVARSLANKATRILGLILPSSDEDLFKNPFFIQVMKGISIYAQKKGYNIMYTYSKSEKDELNFVKNYTNSKLVQGIILLVSRHNDKCIKYLNSIDYPFVVVGRPEDTRKVLWVDNDNFQAMYNVVNTMLGKGHRDIAFIGGPGDMNMSMDRLDGYVKALKVHGIEVEDGLIAEEGDFSEECGYNAMNRIFGYRIPDAVVTTDDLLAFGAMKAISEKKQTIAVAGFNNTPFSMYQTPALSSVDINAESLGYNAAKLLISKLEEENIIQNHCIVEANFIERQSTL